MTGPDSRDADPVAEIEARYREAFSAFEEAGRKHGSGHPDVRQAFIIMDTWCVALNAARNRAAGLLPGPDTITVNREALAHVAGVAARNTNHEWCDICSSVNDTLAALSEPPAPKEQQP